MSDESAGSAIVLDIDGPTVSLPEGADRRFAIERVSFHVRRSEIVCIVGESGSGKSVTAHTVMGLTPRKELKPVSGRILLDGDNLLDKTENELRRLRGERMAMIFQEPMTALNPVMQVGDQITEMLEIHTSMSHNQRRARLIEVMRDVNLPDPETLAHAYPHQLSGGQRQRIMIAMALALKPGLLIADEPTTALDVTTQAQILSLIKDIQESHGTGVMFITHDFGVVAEIADRVVVMQHGLIVEQGDATRVLNEPEHRYTKILINSIPSLIPPARPRRPEKQIALKVHELDKTYDGGGWFRKGRQVNAAQRVELVVRRCETLGVVGE